MSWNWVRCAGVLLTLATVWGCASSNGWMKSGDSRFASQLHTFQRTEVGAAPNPDSKLASAVSKLKAAAKGAQASIKGIGEDSKLADAAEGETYIGIELEDEDAVELTSTEEAEDLGALIAEPPFTDAEIEDPFALDGDDAEPAEDVAAADLDVEEPATEIEQPVVEVEEPAAEDEPLFEIEPRNPEEIELISSLRHPDAGMRALAAWRLGRLEAPSEDVLFALRNVIAEEENGLVRVRMAEAVAKLDSTDGDPVEWLIELLDDGDWEVRWLAAGTLDIAAHGPAKTLAVWKLSEALIGDEQAKVRQMAALTLGSFGSTAESVLPHLREALTDEAADVREAAETALTCIAAANDATR